MWSNNLPSFTSALLLLSTTSIYAAPVSVTTHIETLRISGVDEQEIEHSLNPNHALASVHESTIPRTATLFSAGVSAPQQFLSAEDTEFSATIDGYSTAKQALHGHIPASASLGNLAFDDLELGGGSGNGSLSAFERVRRWMRRRRGDVNEDDMIVTGRMGKPKIRVRR